MKSSKLLIATINPLLARRWSPRSFTGEALNDMKLLQLFEAARWSPSSRNEQPWYFIYADNRNPVEFARIHGCLNESNQSWTAKASALIITFAKQNFDYKNHPNAHAAYDLGGAVANLTIQALELGMYVHQMAGINAEKIRETFDVPEGWMPMTIVAVGFLGDPEDVEEKHRANETQAQNRKKIKEIVATGKWDNHSQIVTD